MAVATGGPQAGRGGGRTPDRDPGLGLRPTTTEALLDEARALVSKALDQALSSGSTDHENLNRVARKALGEAGRRPHPASVR